MNWSQIIKTLGKGAFGKVKLCKDSRDGKLYAFKIMDKNVLKKKRQVWTVSFDSHGEIQNETLI